MKKIFLIFLICISLYSEEKKEISLRIELDKTKTVKSIPIKFLIKNLSQKDIDVSKLELYSFGIYNNEKEGLGVPHTQTTFNHNVKNPIIKRGETFIKVFEFKDFFSVDERYNAFKDSKKDFYFRCVVSYTDKFYECNKLKIKIN